MPSPTSYRPLEPDEIPVGSGMLISWQCTASADHQWQARVRSRTLRGTRCPFYTGRAIAASDSLGAQRVDRRTVSPVHEGRSALD